ncbi:MAG: Rho-type gtpase-activating protein [Alyxoria varia]|nr:MAG: Rho-type gtpase-activating protein [Alyxoria varia]
MDSPGAPDTPVDVDEAVFPCKGCGEILEEGKAFELAGNRWHIDCFRCNTCRTLLDSDANLLLLGDGSLICNNCTYSCSACGNKIEDLAILTGEQAFCASCFKCRNCKRKIDNLRYARTSQGIFCMTCHENLMAKRKKKSSRSATHRAPSANSNGSGHAALDKSLPALPLHAASQTFAEGFDSNTASPGSATPEDNRSPLAQQGYQPRREGTGSSQNKRDLRSPSSHEEQKENLHLLSSRTYERRPSDMSSQHDSSRPSGEDSYIPVAFDPGPGSNLPKRSRSDRETQPDASRSGAEEYLRENFRDLVAGSTGAKAASGGAHSPRARSSPQAAQQDFNRQRSADRMDTLRKGQNATRDLAPANTPSPAHADERSRSQPLSATSEDTEPAPGEGFKLQDVPKGKRLSGSRRGSKESPNPMALAGQTEGTPVLETGVAVNVPSSSSESQGVSEIPTFPQPRGSIKKSRLSNSSSSNHTPAEKPTRSESTKNNSGKQQIPRKEVPKNDPDSASSGSRSAQNKISSSTPIHKPDSSTYGDPYISSPISASGTHEAFEPPPRSSSRPTLPPSRPSATRGETENDDFTAPREAPAPPAGRHAPNESVTSIQSEHFQSKEPSSPVPAYDLLGDYSAEGERDEDVEHPGLFRKVSRAVKHGRSYSDKMPTSVSPKWQKSRNGSIDISSPIMSTPEGKEDQVQLRNRLRFSQQRIAELESEKNSLQEKVNGTVDIRQVNTELREKRSTMAFLDSQREMVIRELEVMTEHLAKAKDSGAPLDVASIKNEALRDFASSLQKLKEELGGHVEELMQQKNTLTNEISDLIQMKDKGNQEYESLSKRNMELTDMNKDLIRNIQELYRQGRHQNGSLHPTQAEVAAPNGLGIYTGAQRPKAESSTDIHIPITAESSQSQVSGDVEVEPVTHLTAPQVVNIRKTGQPKKFNWRKGGENITKNVKKGFKGAFSSNINPTVREESFSEGAPYGSLPEREAPVMGDRPAITRFGLDQNRQQPPGWNFLSQKSGTIRENVKEMREHLVSNLPADSALYGSDLTARADYEKRIIPAIVTRCVEEVEHRGIDVEGIYRKSGSISQIKVVQQGFEKDPGGFDISDPDLDIHAVTSAMKQYLRKLPNPLITFDVYDGFLEAGQLDGDQQRDQARLEGMAKLAGMLPRCHRDTLEFLVFHLVRVMEQEKENLMTYINLAVVFAPTIMRAPVPERDISDMEPQRKVMQCLLQYSRLIFGRSSEQEQQSSLL